MTSRYHGGKFFWRTTKGSLGNNNSDGKSYHGSKSFWKTTKGNLGNNDGDGNENSKKSNKVLSVKQQHFERASRFFCTFFTIVARM